MKLKPILLAAFAATNLQAISIDWARDNADGFQLLLSDDRNPVTQSLARYSSPSGLWDLVGEVYCLQDRQDPNRITMGFKWDLYSGGQLLSGTMPFDEHRDKDSAQLRSTEPFGSTLVATNVFQIVSRPTSDVSSWAWVAIIQDYVSQEGYASRVPKVPEGAGWLLMALASAVLFIFRLKLA